MRFALRNKEKLIKAFGEDGYFNILSALKQYSRNTDTIQTTSVNNIPYPVFRINIKDGDTYQFAVLGSKFDVIRVAFYGSIK